MTTKATEATSAPAVSFTGAVKTFGDVRAVDGLDLEIAAGETVALLGLDEPDERRVELFGTAPVTAVRDGRVGAMLQEGRAVPRVTVAELVDFVARRYPAPMNVRDALRLAGIEELAGRRVDKLSGGQTQRVRFAVALAGNPALLVLDEPTAALDVEARHAFWTSMRAYARRGHTVLFSTHYPEEADANADRIVVALFPDWLQKVSSFTPTNRFAQLGTAVADGHAPSEHAHHLSNGEGST
ncbi:ABC transporter ATP-binding protein [Streptomyces fractus]|uniref:ABC transporter ATP-binding protein n=1 Tax=Streptomyces fractus TaxID=641806 RepID=UPI003CEDACEF